MREGETLEQYKARLRIETREELRGHVAMIAWSVFWMCAIIFGFAWLARLVGLTHPSP